MSEKKKYRFISNPPKEVSSKKENESSDPIIRPVRPGDKPPTKIVDSYYDNYQEEISKHSVESSGKAISPE